VTNANSTPATHFIAPFPSPCPRSSPILAVSMICEADVHFALVIRAPEPEPEMASRVTSGRPSPHADQRVPMHDPTAPLAPLRPSAVALWPLSTALPQPDLIRTSPTPGDIESGGVAAAAAVSPAARSGDSEGGGDSECGGDTEGGGGGGRGSQLGGGGDSDYGDGSVQGEASPGGGDDTIMEPYFPPCAILSAVHPNVPPSAPDPVPPSAPDPVPPSAAPPAAPPPAAAKEVDVTAPVLPSAPDPVPPSAAPAALPPPAAAKEADVTALVLPSTPAHVPPSAADGTALEKVFTGILPAGFKSRPFDKNSMVVGAYHY